MTATPRGVKEELVLAGPAARRSFDWELSLTDGLEPVLAGDGSVEIVDGSGAPVAVLPAPFMVDASGEYDVRSTAFEVTVEPSGDGWVYGLVADDGWLDAPERQWPVTIDPTVIFGRFYDCTVTSGTQANTNYCASTGLRTGRTGGGWVRRSLLYFDVGYHFREFDIAPTNVMNAELSLKFTADSGPRRSASLHRVTHQWNNAATWNRRLSNYSWLSPGGSIVSASVPSATYGVPYSSSNDGVWAAEPGRVYWYPTQLVQQWVDGTHPDHGLLLKHVDENAAAEMVFHSGEAADFRDYPQLKVQWSRGVGAQERYTQIGQSEVTERSSYSVNVGSGNLYLTATDLTLPGVADHDLSVQRAYNSLRWRGDDQAARPDEYIGDFGIGWSSTLDSFGRLRWYASQQRMSYTHPSGWTQSFFDPDGDGLYTSPHRSPLELRRLSTGHYEAFDRQTRVTERFASNGRLLSIRDSYEDDNLIAFRYDAQGRISSVDDTRGGGIVAIDRNAAGRITRLVDHTGREHHYGYSGDNLTSYTDPTGAVTGYVYGQEGKLSRITDPQGGHHDVTYRGAFQQFGGSVATTKRPRAGTTTSYAYSYNMGSSPPDAANHQITVTDARGNDTRYYSDRRGRIVHVVDARGVEQSTEYGPEDFVVSAADRAGGSPATSSYQGRYLNSVTTPEGSVYEFSYDDNDEFRPATYTSPQGGTISYGYDTSGGKVNRITDDNGDVSIERADDGFVTSIVNQRGHATTFAATTDGKRLVREAVAPGGARETSYTYDTAYRPVTVTDGRGMTTTYGYDEVDRVTSITYHDGAVVYYVYDGNGRQTVRLDASGLLTSTFDADGNVISEAFGLPRGTQTYAYDAVGNLIRHTDTSVSGTLGRTDYAYGPTNLLTSVTEPSLGSVRPVVTYVYDADSNDLEERRLPTSTGVVEHYDFDGDGRLEEVRAMQGTSQLTRYAYDYDGELRESMTWAPLGGTTETTTTYEYDGSDRLTRASTPNSTVYAYSYDAASNRTGKTITPNGGAEQATRYAYDTADQLCRSRTGGSSVTCATSTGLSGVTGYTHDAAGNLIGSTAGLDLTVNDAGQTTGLSSLTGTNAAQAAYAGFGQAERYGVDQTVFTTAATGVTARHDPVQGATRWVRDPGGNLLSQRTSTGAVWYLSDGLGSVVRLVDQSGTVAGLFTYQPYGESEVTLCSGQCVHNPWRYTGEYRDPTGMYKIGERYYSPELGRWTQADPAANRINPTMPGEPNPYAYAACNPINHTDPTGLCVGRGLWAAVNLVAVGLSWASLAEPTTTITGTSVFLVSVTTVSSIEATGGFFRCVGG